MLGVDNRTPGRRAVDVMIELAATPGFEQLPTAEQDYLLELVVWQAYGKEVHFRAPPLTERPLS